MFGIDNFLLVFIVVIFIVVLAVLSLLLPVFVVQIRNSAKRIEKQLSNRQEQ